MNSFKLIGASYFSVAVELLTNQTLVGTWQEADILSTCSGMQGKRPEARITLALAKGLFFYKL